MHDFKRILIFVGLLICYRLYKVWKERSEATCDMNFLPDSKRISANEIDRPRITERMELKRFWEIIDSSRQDSKDISDQCEKLEIELRKLTANEIVEFDNRFGDLQNKLYTWNLWGAIYLINGGCSDDTFSDFRAWLIGQGKDRFSNALLNVESIVEFVNKHEDWEGLEFCANSVYTEITNERYIPGDMKYIEEPFGSEWTEDELPNKFPVIWAKIKSDNVE